MLVEGRLVNAFYDGVRQVADLPVGATGINREGVIVIIPPAGDELPV